MRTLRLDVVQLIEERYGVCLWMFVNVDLSIYLMEYPLYFLTNVEHNIINIMGMTNTEYR